MPKTATRLQRAAAAQEDAARETKAIGVLAALASLLGVPAPDAKMSKRTEVTKHTVTEESDDPPASEEEEEEEEAEMDSASDMPSTEKSSDGSAPGSQDEEEEEEEAARGAGYSEEEEEKAIARGWKAAIAAYAKETKGVDAYGVHGPKGLLRAAEKASGAKGARASIAALRDVKQKVAKAEAKAIGEQAKIEARLSKVEATTRKQRVDAIVDKAKAEGRAPSKALRAELRAHGMEHGSKALRRLVATLPVVANTKVREPKIDAEGNALGAPTEADQRTMEKMMAGLDEKGREQFLALYRDKAKALNGAGRLA